MPEVLRENTVTDTEEGRALLQSRLSLFGFALFSLAFVSWAALALAFAFGAALTGDTKIAGTPLYMAPESIAAPTTVDGRTDIYALGAVAWFLLVGRPPFEGKSVVEICSAHLHVAPKPPSTQAADAAIPPALDDLVLACLAKTKDERPASARALRDALAACRTRDVWTEDRAAAWWADHGRTDARERARVDASSVVTLEVDVARRDDKVA